MCITVRWHGMGSGMVGHVQQSVRKMAKHTLKELKELNKVSTERKDMVVSLDRPFLLC